MILAKMTATDDRPLYVFGLSQENLDRLAMDQPIRVRLERMGGVGDVWLVYGETQQTLLKQFAEFVGPDTVVNGTATGGHA